MVPTLSQSVCVSVIVPVFNAERYIVNALDSILQEQAVPLEVIVVNDGTTDGSLSKLRQFTDPRLRLIESGGCGIAAAMNTGLSHAKGEFVVRCDADDLYPLDRIRQQVNWLSDHPHCGAVCGGYAAIDAKGELLVEFRASHPEDISQELRAGAARTHFCTYMIRTSILRDLGGFRTYFTTAEDIDLQLRLGEACSVWYLPSVSYYYRLHKSSITHTKSSIERQFFDEVARHFQQQRQMRGNDDLQLGYPPLPPKDSLSRPLTAAEHIQNFLLWRAWCEHQAGQKWQALITGLRSALAFPYRWSTWRSLLVLLLKPAQPLCMPIPSAIPLPSSVPSSGSSPVASPVSSTGVPPSIAFPACTSPTRFTLKPPLRS